MTASFTSCPRYSSALFFKVLRISAETCCGAKPFPPASTQASPLSALIILNGTMSLSFDTTSSSNLLPINLFMAYRVFSGLVTDCLLALCPTRISSV